MSRPVLRRASTVLLAACAAVATLLLTTGPAVATAGGGASGASAGFGAGLWDGMILTFPIGILVGLLAFAMSRPGEIHRDGE